MARESLAITERLLSAPFHDAVALLSRRSNRDSPRDTRGIEHIGGFVVGTLVRLIGDKENRGPRNYVNPTPRAV